MLENFKHKTDSQMEIKQIIEKSVPFLFLTLIFAFLLRLFFLDSGVMPNWINNLDWYIFGGGVFFLLFQVFIRTGIGEGKEF